MTRLEKALAGLNDAITRVEAAAEKLQMREARLRDEAAEMVAAAIDELRRASDAMPDILPEEETGETRQKPPAETGDA